MKFFFLILFFAFSLQAAPSGRWHVIKIKELDFLSGGAVLKSITVQQGSDRKQEVVMTAVLFSEKNDQLQVIDNPARDRTLAQVMQEQHCLAGINGGYFHPDGRPLGLVIADGKVIHEQEMAPRLLSGFVVVTKDNKMQLLHVGERIPAEAREVLQAGPFLINHQVSVPGLETTRVARRTFVATDEHGMWMIGVISPVTLADAARVLKAAASQFFSTHPLERALNLDGGSSSALWVNCSPAPFSQSELGTVRNFLAIKKLRLQQSK